MIMDKTEIFRYLEKSITIIVNQNKAYDKINFMYASDSYISLL
jgi:hypothetical protein